MPNEDIPRKRITKKHLLEVLDDLLNDDETAWMMIHDLEARMSWPSRSFIINTVRDYLTTKAIANEDTG